MDVQDVSLALTPQGKALRLEVARKSNTAQMCEPCDYRMIPIDDYRDACNRCGIISGNETRSARMVAIVFGGKIQTEVYYSADG